MVDYGADSADPMDYPDVIHPAAKAVAAGECDRGVFICCTGQGTAMVANRYPGVRSALCWNRDTAELSRRHNDANCLSLPARFISTEEAVEILKIWLTTGFDGGRHARRVKKIDKILDL